MSARALAREPRRWGKLVMILLNLAMAVVVLGNLRSDKDAIRQCQSDPYAGARSVCIGMTTSTRNLDTEMGFGAWAAADLIAGLTLAALARRREKQPPELAC